MKTLFLVILSFVFCIPNLSAQSKERDTTKSLTEVMENVELINYQNGTSSVDSDPRDGTINFKFEEQIARQQIIIESQEMMIEQIMKRLEILEKSHHEKPLDPGGQRQFHSVLY